MRSPPSALKKSLVAEGFEIYRTSPSWVALADRVRDNLLMDAGVAALQGETLGVRVVLRVRGSDFPGELPEHLLDRARALGEDLRQKGYREVSAEAVPLPDPGDRSRTLDTWYEVSLERSVADEPELFAELRYALALPKTIEKA